MTEEVQKHPGGRPLEYTKEIGEAICLRLENGESLKRITDEDGMPERSTVYRWLLRVPEFRNKYEESRDIQADVFADELDEIARDEGLEVQRAKLIIDTRKWITSKIKPKKYGDKLDVTSQGKELKPAVVIDFGAVEKQKKEE